MLRIGHWKLEKCWDFTPGKLVFQKKSSVVGDSLVILSLSDSLAKIFLFRQVEASLTGKIEWSFLENTMNVIMLNIIWFDKLKEEKLDNVVIIFWPKKSKMPDY